MLKEFLKRNIVAFAFWLAGACAIVCVVAFGLSSQPIKPLSTAMERADQNIKVLNEAQTKCAQIHGTLRATLVNRFSHDRKLVCDVNPNLSLDMGVIAN